MATQGALTTSSSEQQPPGWEIEHRIRTGAGKHQGRCDTFYYEPGSGKQYRSRKAAWDCYWAIKLGKIKGGRRTMKPTFKKDGVKKTRLIAKFDFLNPPDEVTWVFNDPAKDECTPYVGGKEVPESEKKVWAEVFAFTTRWKIQ